MKQPVVYILASRRNGTFYIGVTSNLLQRIWQHKNNAVKGFTKKYGVHILVYFELHCDMLQAIEREKQIKKWDRVWKLKLIEKENHQWNDLWPLVVGDEGLDSRWPAVRDAPMIVPRLRGDDSGNDEEKEL